MKLRYLKLDKVKGPLIILDGVKEAMNEEEVRIFVGENDVRRGKVVLIDGEKVIIQVFEGTGMMGVENSQVEFTGKVMDVGVDDTMFGRTFNGIGEPIDGGGYYPSHTRPISAGSINPIRRVYPRDFIQTGISAIDGLTTLIKGQKLPIFSSDGIEHNRLIAQIVRQSKISDETGAKFGIIFGAMGLKYDEANYFKRQFEASGASEKVISFINLAHEPIAQRIITPKLALAVAEYFAFEKGMDILVILSNMTSYCEALREISSQRDEVPSRKGYPGYLYSDLASIYERAGIVEGSGGSITQIPILTMPNDDITHPIPDLTGYITEGQIMLSKELSLQGIYPPISILPSLSRLMKDGIGEGYTREDHADVSSQIFAAYSKVGDIRELAGVIGSDDLSENDKKYLAFGDALEKRLLNQGDQDRSVEETLDLMWDLLRLLPSSDLDRIDPKLKEKYLGVGKR